MAILIDVFKLILKQSGLSDNSEVHFFNLPSSVTIQAACMCACVWALIFILVVVKFPRNDALSDCF